jgi:hypothetical protein
MNRSAAIKKPQARACGIKDKDAMTLGSHPGRKHAKDTLDERGDVFHQLTVPPFIK